MNTLGNAQAAVPRPVAINTAGADELDGLYGIGPALALRIVSYRQENGPFASPQDLARVDGIGAELAGVLAPHIDWSPPAPQDDVNDDRSLLVAAIAFAGAIACARSVLHAVENIQYDFFWWPRGWRFLLWAHVSHGMTMATATVAITLLGFSGLTRSKRRDAALTRVALRVSLLMLIPLVSFGLANAAWYTFSVPGGWSAFFASRGEVLILLTSILLLGPGAQVMGPFLRPGLADNRALKLFSSVCAVFLIPATAAWFWTFRNQLPLWMVASYGLAGVFMVGLGVSVLRGTSLVQAIIDRLWPGDAATADNLWVRWINQKLPDPQQQQALLQALQRLHPPSRWRTLRGVIVTGAGAWLMAATAGAVWEWLVQNWLDSFGR